MQRISLANEFLEGSNNSYLFCDERTVLVDTGSDTPAIREQLLSGFAEAGTEMSELDEIYLTHYHIDHCELLEWVVSESGASVYAHADDAPLIEGDIQAWSQLIETRYDLLEQWGVPQSGVETVEDAVIEGSDIYGDVDVTPMTEDTIIDIGETTLQPIHTPGHSLGHLSFAIPERNEILTGDALLPVYTPNVGGADVRVDRPLDRYVTSLQRIAAGDYNRAWPGHRTPITAPTERANEIIAHHEERAMRVLRTLTEFEAATPWEIAVHLFGTLEWIHILHGPGEVYAHLDHLTRAECVERSGTEYRVTAETRERLSEMDDETRWPLTRHF